MPGGLTLGFAMHLVCYVLKIMWQGGLPVQR